MFDPLLRRLIDPPLDRAGRWLARLPMGANAWSVAGLGVGLLSVPLLAVGRFDLALGTILLNRLIDGLDGAVARHKGPTRFGGYLDIMCDMAFYAAVPVGFALARPEFALWAALLLASFVCTGTSFLGRALLAQQRNEPDDGARGAKSFFHSAGLVEGSETIVAFVLFCLFPSAFPGLAGLFAALCLLTAISRVFQARQANREESAESKS